MSKSSEQRIKRFVDWLIRSDWAQSARESNINNDYGLDGRFARVHDAAENGCDGSTHQEVIEDWRDAFRDWMRERTRGKWYASYDRFEAAVEAYFDSVEVWHEQNGTLFKQIG
jgi:hypothetical protein